MTIASVNPRTGAAESTGIEETSSEGIAELCRRAADHARPYRRLPRRQRAAFLRRVADELQENQEELVAIADRETALGEPRLTGELVRTAFQMRAFARVLEEGSYLEIVLDHAGDTDMGPRPELRRMLVPVGPVAVFGASNFPFAFSVCGGDTAAALAAGCPVLIKAHASHPETSRRTFELLQRSAADSGVPDGAVSLVFGHEAGRQLVQDPHVKAVGFTGSEAGGRALHDLACSRPDPIPFYGELGSINPLVVTPGAARARAGEIAAGYVGSVTLGGGQFCTKPGLLFAPADGGNQLKQRLVDEIEKTVAPWLLNEGIYEAYTRGVGALADAFEGVGRVGALPDQGFAVDPALYWTTAGAFAEDRGLLLTECFGPVGIVVEYDSPHELLDMVRRLPGALVGTVHGEPGEEALTAELLEELGERVGRIVWNGYPTGVAVAWAMTHGGPYPSSTSLHTSVGETSVRRFLRPVSYQSVPQALLPEELRDQELVGMPRRVDGAVTGG